MNKLLLTAALVGISAGSVSIEANAKNENVKCLGVAKVGKNDCAAVDGSHSCAGYAKKDNDKNEWKFITRKECKDLGGIISNDKNSCKQS